MALVARRGTDLLLHRCDHPPLQLSGRLAAALERRLRPEPVADSCPLAAAARHLPALEGIAQATPTSDALRQLVCGDLGLLFVELTLRCNERCLHCYADATPEQQAHLSAEEIIDLLDQARALGRARVQFTGGDPLIHPELVTAVRHARARDFATIEIYTNGLLLHDALLQRLTEAGGAALAFAFSLYSHDAARHDAVTRLPGSWQRTITAIRRVVARGIPCRVSIITMAHNRDDAEPTRALLRSMGVEEAAIAVHPIRAIGRGRDQSVDRDEEPALPTPLPPRRGKLCVAADGAILPCIFARGRRLGNIRRGAIVEQLRAIPIGPASAAVDACHNQLSCHDCRTSAWLLGGKTDPSLEGQ